ncbi:MAG: TIGR03915 family putative DNA repair protein [Peptostreptococcaceae bacterium]|nr:TIGR03915 family putative DNA repair protein [Peptostreptococcaceae bacterium]
MIDYWYDGTFDGLLTVVFDAYKEQQKIRRVCCNTKQMRWDDLEIFVPTDFAKARRVEKYIRNEISLQFMDDVRACFLSYQQDKDTVAVRTIYRAVKIGAKIMDIMEDDVIRMRQYVKQVLGERHRYLGLVRFREMKDGTLFSVIEPKNNILPTLIAHFKNRLRNERFAIFDKKRGMLAYYDTESTELFLTESVNAEWSDEELVFSELWKLFHRSISIKERENKILQRGNLPKYYWKHLIEEM